eukprot:12471666-Prorocentrum_lima.AAC.1
MFRALASSIEYCLMIPMHFTMLHQPQSILRGKARRNQGGQNGGEAKQGKALGMDREIIMSDESCIAA